MQTPKYIAAVFILVGAAIRLTHLTIIDVGLPFRLGGLFVEFATQISANNYLIPDWIPFYTEGGIPFAYPPLAFYIQAIILDVTSVPVFALVNLLPSLLLILTLPSFHLLTGEIGLDVRTRLAALLAYATMPVTFVEQIEGGGLPEALGTLVFIWLVFFLVRAYRRGSVGTHATAGVFLALAVLASPATAYASVFLFAIFGVAYLARDGWRLTRRSVTLVVMSGLVGVALSSPYWLAVAGNHGPVVFLDSVSGQHAGLFASAQRIIGTIVEFNISGHDFAFFWDFAILIGLAMALRRRQILLIAWFVVLLIIPGEGRWLASTPAAILAGIGVSTIWKLLPTINEGWITSNRWRAPAIGAIGALFIAYAFSNGLLSILDLSFDDPHLGMTSHTVSAMAWVDENTPDASKLVVMSGPGVLEWSPHLTRREVLNIPFGAEWQPEEEGNILAFNGNLRKCMDLGCVYRHARESFPYMAFLLMIDNDRLEELTIGPVQQHRNESGSPDFEVLMTNEEISLVRLSGS